MLLRVPSVLLFLRAVLVFLSVCAFLDLCSGSEKANAAPAEPLIRIGMTQGGHEAEHVRIFDSTREALEDHFGKENVRFEVIHVQTLTNMILRGDVNFFISTAGMSRRMMTNGTRDLLTVTTRRFPDPNHSYGSVFLVRNDSPYKTIDDLKGTRYVGNRPQGFYGYIVAMGELERQGYSHDVFFRSSTFLDTGSSSVIDALIRGDADTATVPSCFLEDNYAPDSEVRRSIRVIGARKGEKVGERETVMPCMRSTADYPNWALSSSPSTPAELSREVTRVLLGMKSDDNGVRWSIATDFAETDRLYRHLKAGVYDILRGWTLKTFLREYSGFIAASALVFLLLAVYGFLMTRQVKNRTQEMTALLNQQIRLEKSAAEAERRFESLQKLGIIGQMSSMIAHELRQPLSTMLAYLHGMRRLAEQGSIDGKQAEALLEKVEDQARKAEMIVEKVRRYSKRKENDRSPQRLEPVVKTALSVFRASGRFSGFCTFEVKGSPVAILDSMEMELAVLNLLRNAADSLNAAGTPSPQIIVTLSVQLSKCVIVVMDNGPSLTWDDVQRMATPLESTKPNGLGIGLSLVRTIAESHGGRLILTPGNRTGLKARIELPLYTEEKDYL